MIYLLICQMKTSYLPVVMAVKGSCNNLDEESAHINFASSEVQSSISTACNQFKAIPFQNALSKMKRCGTSSCALDDHSDYDDSIADSDFDDIDGALDEHSSPDDESLVGGRSWKRKLSVKSLSKNKLSKKACFKTCYQWYEKWTGYENSNAEDDDCDDDDYVDRSSVERKQSVMPLLKSISSKKTRFEICHQDAC